MNKRHVPVERPVGGPVEIQARRLLRLKDAVETLPPVASSDLVGSPGIFAEIYKTDSDVELGPVSLEDAAVLIVNKGTVTARLLFAETERVLAAGGLAVLPAASVFSLLLSSADLTVCYLRADNTLGLAGELTTSREIVPALDPQDVPLAFLMNCIRIELQAGNVTGRAYIESLGLTLVIRLYARYAIRVAVAGTFRGGLTARQVRNAKSSILSELDKEVPLAALAQEARLSKSHFSRAFKISTGASPRQWRLNKRIELARRLIMEEGKTITSIAVALGFASLSHFSAAFKRATGLSPSHYRRKSSP